MKEFECGKNIKTVKEKEMSLGGVVDKVESL